MCIKSIPRPAFLAATALVLLLAGAGTALAQSCSDLKTAIECCRERPRDAGYGLAGSRIWGYGQLRWTDPRPGEETLGLYRSKLICEPKFGRRVKGFAQVLYRTGNDLSSDDALHLLDAWVRVDLGKGKLQVGQFKPPMGLERFTWDGALDLADRSMATDRLIPNGKYGDAFTRDYGAQWTTTWRSHVSTALAVFGGRGANTDPSDPMPLLCARVIWKPQKGCTNCGLNRCLRLGLSACTREGGERNFSKAVSGSSALGYKTFSGRDTRVQAELLYEHGMWKTAAELFYARFASDREEVPSLSVVGGYVSLAVHPLARWSFAARVETFDPRDDTQSCPDTDRLTLGANFYISQNKHMVRLNRWFDRVGEDHAHREGWILQYQLVI